MLLFFIERHYIWVLYKREMANKKSPPPAGYPHIGTMLKTYVKKKRISQAAWARAQGIRDATVMRYFKHPDMRIHTLITISKVLKYNFLKDLLDTVPADLPPFTENVLEQQVGELQLENEKLKEQVELLKEVLMGRK